MMSTICDDLRAAILQAAIQGKLTEQMPEDGDAEDLLEEIKAEKERLITEGKIKKQKSLAPITDDETPFSIPENWKWVRLGEIGDWGSGTTPSKTKPEYYKDGNIKWLLTGDLNNGLITDTTGRITELALEKTSVRLNPIGSVLIAMYGATIGKLGVLDVEATTNQACCACVPYDGLYNWYLFYFLMQHKAAFISEGAGAAQPNISKEKIIATIMPLPPLAEQRRIVEKVDKLMIRVADLEQSADALASLKKAFPDDIKASLLQYAMQGKLTKQLPEDGDAEDLLEEIKAEKEKLIAEGKIKKQKPFAPITDDKIPFNIPENWKWVRMDSIFNIHSSIRIHQSDWKTSGIPFFRGRELVKLAKNGDVDPEIFISKELYEENKRKGGIPQKDDILVSAVGTIGKAYIVKGDRPFYYKDAYVLCFDNIGNIIPQFIKYAIEAPCINDVIMRGSMGTTVAQLTIDKAKNLLLPLPPISEQKRIVERLDTLMQNINTVGDLIASE